MKGRRGSLYGWAAFVVVMLVVLVVAYPLMGKPLGDALILAGVALVGAVLGVCLREVFRGRSRRRAREARSARHEAEQHD
ncbi:hypothetical protein KVA01_23460 [Kocuria varians]|uniref:Uncharacterized protein n=2 Tax=Kocuria varians TaxID=1272 RepID=A0A4Y4D4R4_KOCVA|nr:hypothetical protein KVA01_23460 [Kocuria varians]